MHPAAPRVVAAAALVDDVLRPTRLLAARRRGPAGLRGRWEFPGGKVEPGESPQQAVRRELREELGVRITLGGRVTGPVDGLWPLSPDYLLSLWWAVTPDRPAPLAEHDELRWLSAAELAAVPWLDSNTAIVARVAQLMHRG